MWDDDGENILEHFAGIEDFDLAMTTYRAACLRGPVPLSRFGRARGLSSTAESDGWLKGQTGGADDYAHPALHQGSLRCDRSGHRANPGSRRAERPRTGAWRTTRARPSKRILFAKRFYERSGPRGA